MAGPLEPAGLPTTCGPAPLMMIFPQDLVIAPLINKVSDVLALISFSAAPEHVFPSRETSEPGKNRIRFRYSDQYPDRYPDRYQDPNVEPAEALSQHWRFLIRYQSLPGSGAKMSRLSSLEEHKPKQVSHLTHQFSPFKSDVTYIEPPETHTIPLVTSSLDPSKAGELLHLEPHQTTTLIIHHLNRGPTTS